jgi:hypothetical protein
VRKVKVGAGALDLRVAEIQEVLDAGLAGAGGIPVLTGVRF